MNIKERGLLSKEKLPEKLWRYALTKGNQEKIDKIIDIRDIIDIMDLIKRWRKGERKEREKERKERKGERKERNRERNSERKEREKEREKLEKYRKTEKRREKEKTDGQGHSLSIGIQFSKRKTKYIGRNAQNLKKWPLRIYIKMIDDSHFKSSCRS